MNRTKTLLQRIFFLPSRGSCRSCYPVYFLVALGSAIASTSIADGLVDVGTQPRGGLSGKVVYTHGGHGITAANKRDGAWTFQRGPGHQMIEDLGNIDQMAFLVDYLFRAGATIAPLRPVGNQVNEVVLDNNDAGVTFEGDWAVPSDAPVYFGEAGKAPYKQAATSKKETARARYTPNIPEAGFYPVYAWTSSGGDRATDQLYRVHHAGGASEVKVNHRRVGNGLVYLGTYYFDAGSKGSVEISNQSDSDGSVVVADMIRFGNGKGDISRGDAGISKWGRQDESGLYWVKWHADRAHGVAESDYRATDDDRQAAISFSPRYAAYMNREADGRLPDRVFVSFHSNAGGGGKARGTLGLLNGNNDPKTATPNQLLLAKSLAKQVNDDLVEMGDSIEHKWSDRGEKVTLDRQDIDFGEINNKYINDEFDATIIEVAFHDNKEDAELMRDPRVRDAVGRATYKGLLKYFGAVGGNSTPATVLPAPVTGVDAESEKPGSVTISWMPAKASALTGDAATSYRIYASTNGYGFDGGTEVAAKDATSATIGGLDPKTVYYFKVVAVNEGGESEASEVVAATADKNGARVLIVNGFDRVDRMLDPQEKYHGKMVDRVRQRANNSRDYAVPVAQAIRVADPQATIATASHRAAANGDVDPLKHSTQVWILGAESTGDHTLNEAEQKYLAKLVADGGKLFISGSDIGLDLDDKDHGRAFYRDTLKAKFVADKANTYEVVGAAGGIFDGLKFALDNGALSYDVNAADVIAAEDGADVALTYANGAGAAGVVWTGANKKGAVVTFGFPFESITTAAERAEVMRRVLALFSGAESKSARQP